MDVLLQVDEAVPWKNAAGKEDEESAIKLSFFNGFCQTVASFFGNKARGVCSVEVRGRAFSSVGRPLGWRSCLFFRVKA